MCPTGLSDLGMLSPIPTNEYELLHTLTFTCAAEATSFAYCMISSSSRVLICHAASQLQHVGTSR